jgi:acetyl-CoA C-acetyltransferase
MGISAEKVAEKYGFTREEQDHYALRSHEKAAAAQRTFAFKEEILPVEIATKSGPPQLFTADESVRADASLDALAKLKPAFKPGGTVTAGNAPGCNDAAAACVVASGRAVEEFGIRPLARVLGYATGGTAPEWVMMAPVESTRKLNAKLGLAMESYDLIELNEAFAVQALGVMKELEPDPARVNVNGGAVALGHPIGASGARILVTLLHALRARKGRRGLASLCLGGGNAVSMAVEMGS